MGHRLDRRPEALDVQLVVHVDQDVALGDDRPPRHLRMGGPQPVGHSASGLSDDRQLVEDSVTRQIVLQGAAAGGGGAATRRA